MNETPNYPWYQIGQMEDLQQGDLILECPIINISGNSFDSLNDDEVTDIEVSIERVNLIILSQSCDLANNKITEHVLLCGLTPSSKHNKNIDNIRTNKMPALCLIEAFDIADLHLPSFEKQVVDFRAVYTLPKNYISAFVKDKTRTRLLPPYREYVAQAFARFFMRVGLPKDL
jgi:hypothetical protein